ncbi:hypothetical protein GCK72_022506 [Caenorhabditis remanei]|uniref:Homeobox domain-containing protein n=1 Tax=Caenorhabditis remanei TaxID=31234 RepID=A0A6A5FU77_CAERE|nr:hypothetical protein GCK72_022506 [Caenorhabditis remanei]KAF1746055.1 hypothetical protein GCK72_022506 [Caenorhabditis remanei]
MNCQRSMPQQAVNLQKTGLNFSNKTPKEETKKPRKTRTPHNVYQLEKLEERYKKSPKINMIEVEKLGAEIGLSGEQVYCWFKNRRRHRQTVRRNAQSSTSGSRKPLNQKFSISSLLTENSPISPVQLAAESTTDESESENLNGKKDTAHQYSIDKLLAKFQQKTQQLADNLKPNTPSLQGSFNATNSSNGYYLNGAFPVFGFHQPFIGIPMAPLFTPPVNSPAPVLFQKDHHNSSHLSLLPKSGINKCGKFTFEQYEKLEKRFNEKPNIEQPEKKKFAAEIGLTSAQVANCRVQLSGTMPRKTQPRKLRPPPPPQQVFPPSKLNEYSMLVTSLLVKLDRTSVVADAFLQDLRRTKNAKRMFIGTNGEALIASKNVQAGDIVLEMNGHVSLTTEVEKPAGGGNGMFLYEGLTSKKRDVICIDTNGLGSDTNPTRRSCKPNCVLKHIMGTEDTLGIMLVATKFIRKNDEITLPFDFDYKDSLIPLKCVEHTSNIHTCPFERCRLKLEDIDETESNGTKVGEDVMGHANTVPVQPAKERSRPRSQSCSSKPRHVPTTSASTASSTASSGSKAKTSRPPGTTTARRNSASRAPVATKALTCRRLSTKARPIAVKALAGTTTNTKKLITSRQDVEVNDQNMPGSVAPPSTAPPRRVSLRKMSTSSALATASTNKAPLGDLRSENSEEAAAGKRRRHN